MCNYIAWFLCLTKGKRGLYKKDNVHAKKFLSDRFEKLILFINRTLINRYLL